MASSSASQNYVVFLNFCGKDTRQGFISHLYDALRAEGIETFIDEEGIDKGERIEKIFEVIKEARLYIVVYSKSYASSQWCLRELVEIMNNSAEPRRILPVFYKVNPPSDVISENSITHDHLQKHELEVGKSSKTVANWKEALVGLAGIKGWHFENGAESKLVKEVVSKVSSLSQRRSMPGSMGKKKHFSRFFQGMIVETGPSFAEAAMRRIAQGTKVLAEGGHAKMFLQTFETVPGEQLQNWFACYLSTTTGPVMGTLYVSTAKFAFCSDSPLSYTSGNQIEFSYYKVEIPLHQLKAVNPSASRSNPSEKYIQVISVDNNELWFMGFLHYYNGALPCLENALQSSSTVQST